MVLYWFIVFDLQVIAFIITVQGNKTNFSLTMCPRLLKLVTMS